MVVLLMGVLAALTLPTAQPAVGDQLLAAANVLLADLDYARSLAVANDSSYTITLDTDEHAYTLTHTGSNPALDSLPPPIFPSPDDTATAHVTRLNDLPNLQAAGIELLGGVTGNGPMTTTTTIEFNSLGQTTSPTNTIIWLAAGQGVQRRYVDIEINAVTGLAIVGEVQGTLPAGAQVLVAALPSGHLLAGCDRLRTLRPARWL